MKLVGRNKKAIIATAVLLMIVVLVVGVLLYSHSRTDRSSMPYYFIAVHNEPYHFPGGEKQIEIAYAVLQQMVEYTNEHNIKLTLMFTPQWADFIAESPERLADLESWKKQGHEIAAHHHGLYHGNWDGYTDYSQEEARALRIKQGKMSEQYLGTLGDYTAKLKIINPAIRSGCMNDERDKRDMPDEIIYDTCSGFANFAEPGTRMPDTDPEKGKNEYVTVGTYRNIKREWLAHYQITTDSRQELAQAVFNSMNSGVHGAVTHSVDVQAQAYYKFVEFLHSKDPSGEMSRTVSGVIEGLLPEKVIDEKLLTSARTIQPVQYALIGKTLEMFDEVK